MVTGGFQPLMFFQKERGQEAKSSEEEEKEEEEQNGSLIYMTC